MGTRSLTVFKNEDGQEIAVLYRQFDGYLKGMGKDLKDFLKGKRLTNGIGAGDEANFNGMSDLAVQTIAHLKVSNGKHQQKSDRLQKRKHRPLIGAGNYYLYPAGTRDCGEEYIYEIYPSSKTEFDSGTEVKPIIRATDVYYNEVIFEGPPEKLEILEKS